MCANPANPHFYKKPGNGRSEFLGWGVRGRTALTPVFVMFELVRKLRPVLSWFVKSECPKNRHKKGTQPVGQVPVACLALVFGLEGLVQVEFRVASEHPRFVSCFHPLLTTRTDFSTRDALVVMQPIHLLVVALRTALSAVVVGFYVIHLLPNWLAPYGC